MSCGTSGNQACALQGNDVTCLSRVYRQSDGSLLTTAEITRIQQTIYDMADYTTPIDQSDLIVGSVFFDTLQLDGRWTVDEIGYNFAATIGASKLTAEMIRIEYLFFLVDGSQMAIDPFELQILPVHSVP